MSAIATGVAKKYARKAFGERAAILEPADPHYETYVDERGRTKSRKRKMPPGLTKADARILRSVRRRAHYLDKGFTICGFRFGWTAILGLIPFAGDIAAFLLSYFLVTRKCRQANLPLILQQRMAFNQAVSLGSGMIPLVGDVILAVWKTNSRNAALLEEFLIARALQADGGGGSTAQTDEAAAQQAIKSSKIDKSSGEPVGGGFELPEEAPAAGGGGGASSSAPQGTASASRVAQPSSTTAATATAKPKTAVAGKSWYGWGQGKQGGAGATEREQEPFLDPATTVAGGKKRA